MRVLIAGILGAVAMYVWSTVAHLSPLAMVGVHSIPGERILVAALQLSLGDKGGLYVYPSPSTADTSKTGPEGLIAYTPHGTGGVTPRQLGVELVLQVTESLLMAGIAALAGGGVWRRVAIAVLVGLIAGMATNFSYWNWYGFGLDYTLANGFIELVKFLLAGLVIAAMLRVKKAT
ncbi:MAG TPA: hypothetical protein VN805_05920 [Caulobacteraceae bacterium]|nr:hypothetical protein [Caulobacteraceae bacterium]